MIVYKEFLADTAVTRVKDGMIVGVGAGSTVDVFVKRLVEYVLENQMHIKFVSADPKLNMLASAQGVTVLDIANVSELDILFDGADYVNVETGLVSKGNGGFIFDEMFLAGISKESILLVDESKLNWERLPKVFLEVRENLLAEVFNDLSVFDCFLREGLSAAGNLVLEVNVLDLANVNSLIDVASGLDGVLTVGAGYGVYDKVWIARKVNDSMFVDKFNLKND